MKNIVHALDRLKRVECLNSIEYILDITKEILLSIYNVNIEAVVFRSSKTQKTRVWYKNSLLDDKAILTNSNAAIENTSSIITIGRYFVPLHAMGICFGAVMLHSNDDDIDIENMANSSIQSILEIYEDDVNIILSYVSLLLYSQKLSFEANTDRLTKIHNRGYILDHIESLQNAEKPYSIMLFDVDRFKYYNDRYGHNIGDFVLKLLAKTIKDTLDCDAMKDYKFARYGGEEFIVVVPSDDKDSVIKSMEILKTAITTANFSTDKYSLKVTVSIGASNSKVGKDSYDTIEEADKALYIAKETGRNRFVFFDFPADTDAKSE